MRVGKENVTTVFIEASGATSCEKMQLEKMWKVSNTETNSMSVLAILICYSLILNGRIPLPRHEHECNSRLKNILGEHSRSKSTHWAWWFPQLRPPGIPKENINFVHDLLKADKIFKMLEISTPWAWVSKITCWRITTSINVSVF